MRPTHLIDALVPTFDQTLVRAIDVDATPEDVFDAVRSLDFLAVRTPLVSALFFLRDSPTRFSRWIRGDLSPRPSARLRLADLFDGAVPGEWIGLAEDRPHEIVFGAVGTVWSADIEWRIVAAPYFAGFSEPGYAKMAVSFAIEPAGEGSSILSYEARTTTTDAVSKTRFHRYWLLVRPFVRIIMREALRMAKRRAEQQRVA